MMGWTPIEVAVALSLYSYNVSPLKRAQAIWDHFKGDCMEIVDLVQVLADRSAFAATELPMPSAAVYVRQALEMYGDEARARVRINLELWPELNENESTRTN